MDWIAGRSYYIAYGSIDRFDSLIFFHNYLYTWSLAIFSSLILPILFLFAPSSLHTKRTSHFFIICLIGLANMSCLYIQPYLVNGSGEPKLSFHTCRFVVYISTFAKPMALYLTLLFSIERVFTKILRLTHYRGIFKRFYLLFICLGIVSILAIRLFEVLKYIQRDQSTSENEILSRQTTTDDDQDNENITDRVLTFQYCYRSINKETYAKILSFYLIQYWFEYVILGIISLILGLMIVYQCCLPDFQHRSASRLSVNTKFYFSLSSCLVAFELILHCLHLIVDAEENNNTDTQVNYLQTMLFVYNFRCISLPLIICLTCCDSLKQWLYEFLILRSYVHHLTDADLLNGLIDQSDAFSSTQRTFVKQNNVEHFDM